jgi:hypothetical protein
MGSVTITLNHFSAAAVFALFTSIVFGITHRESTRDMVNYGLYCFAMFLGGGSCPSQFSAEKEIQDSSDSHCSLGWP